MHLCCLQNYKEVCRNIHYECKTDTIYANCADRRSYETHEVPSDALYNEFSYNGASDCSKNIAVYSYDHEVEELACVSN